MNDGLLELILARLGRVPLAGDAADLLLAAAEGEAQLAAQLSGASAPSDNRGSEHAGAEPAGAYLQSISVSGFRGVGPLSTLELEPGPGLTLVVGRNGSGKSSFADGLEVLLTGELRRWEELSAVWQEGWHNLHTSDPARISAQLLLEGAGTGTVERSWASGASFTASAVTMQVTGEKHAGLERLGWQDALASYRPFLSHSELEAFFSGPSRLHDLLSSVLGLEDLAATEKLLSLARRERETRRTEVDRDLPALLDTLGSVDDERARLCRDALQGRKRDVGRALEIAAGAPAGPPTGEIATLRHLSQVQSPDEGSIRNAVETLLSAADTLEKAAGSGAGQALELARLLSSALAHHLAHGAGDCPVCGREGALDERWRVRTEQEIARLHAQARAAKDARDEAGQARAAARALILPVPRLLAGEPIGSADPVAAREAWAAWTTQASKPDEEGPEGLRQLAGHLARAWPRLQAAVQALADAAGAELQSREDRWAPVAAEVAAWAKRAKDAEAAAQALPALKAAIRWLKDATDDIRNERLAPLGSQAREIWAQLRQESNINLGAIRLTGSGPRRQVDMQVTVDGAQSPALGVMSQGEVNALALSIFLPRATLPASPFRFLVIDDPVQAMDPAKVEGLARVLDEVARSRQVLVFTHDDRLPEAIRRLGLPARIREVTRRPGSVVEIRPALTPVERILQDAQAVCADEAVPQQVAARVVPGLCRLAVEAAFTEAARRRQLRDGRRHAEVEAMIQAADTMTKKAALAMFGNMSKGGEVLRRLNAWHPRIADTYQAVNRGAHNGHNGPLPPLVTQTRELTSAIRTRL